jgi:L-ascorbate metabolism protein UlaG (beta-lactamase superfamily)
MIIQWLGNAGFKIQTKGQSGELTVAMDPFEDSDGIKMPKFQSDILTMSCNKNNHNNAEAIKGEPFIVANPGEYETDGVFIYGIPATTSDLKGRKDKSTICKLISEDICIGHLGPLSEPLSDDQIERLGAVDVLLLPIGGNGILDYKKAIEIIPQIEPRIVIPMLYKTAEQKSGPTTLDDFIKHCGLKSETMEKLRLTKKDLMTEDTKLVILTI